MIFSDSTLMRQATLLSRELGVPIVDHAEGGDLVGEVVANIERYGRGSNIVARTGHNQDLRAGRVAYILDEISRGVALGADFIVCQLAMNSEVALGTSPEARAVKNYWIQVNSGLRERFGERYLPLHDRLLARARMLPDLSQTDRLDIAADLLPQRWRAPFGNDGHYSDQGRGECVDILADFVRVRFMGSPPVDPPPVIPPVEPPTTPPPPPRSGLTLLDRLRALIRRRRRRT